MIGGIPLGLGGSTLSFTFTDLPVHRTLSLKFLLFLIDQETGSTYTFYVDIDGRRIHEGNVVIDSAVTNTN